MSFILTLKNIITWVLYWLQINIINLVKEALWCNWLGETLDWWCRTLGDTLIVSLSQGLDVVVLGIASYLHCVKTNIYNLNIHLFNVLSKLWMYILHWVNMLLLFTYKHSLIFHSGIENTWFKLYLAFHMVITNNLCVYRFILKQVCSMRDESKRILELLNKEADKILLHSLLKNLMCSSITYYCTWLNVYWGYAHTGKF